jgi:RNA polymerase sigma factor (sigma-70 family)
VVAGWPGIEDIDDRQLAASLHGAGSKALASIYESYGARLYDYCHTYLRDEADAAEAVHDSLIGAQQHIAKLREPEQLRGWLYAIARKECLRRLDERQQGTERHEAPPTDDDVGLDPQDQARREEVREIAFSALTTLVGRQREAAVLTARHDLDIWQLARVLGIAESQAAELVQQASDNFEMAFTAALIARSGREDCPSVSALIDDTWPPTPDDYRTLIRHIEACPTCGERHQRKLPARGLLQLLPAAQLPAHLWTEIDTTTSVPERRARRLALARRAEPFDDSGWPAHEGQRSGAQRAPRARSRVWPGIAAAVFGVLAIGIAVMVLQGGTTPSTGDQALAAPKVSRPSTSAESPGTVDTPAPTTGRPSATPSATPTSSPTPTPTPTPTKSQAPPPPSPTNPKPTKTPPGTLSVSGCHMSSGRKSCTVTVTANGGPVKWSVRANGTLNASDGGHLSAGQSTGVTISREGFCLGQGSGSVSFSPNGVANVTWNC